MMHESGDDRSLIWVWRAQYWLSCQFGVYVTVKVT